MSTRATRERSDFHAADASRFPLNVNERQATHAYSFTSVTIVEKTSYTCERNEDHGTKILKTTIYILTI
jgi:hypothetical protein